MYIYIYIYIYKYICNQICFRFLGNYIKCTLGTKDVPRIWPLSSLICSMMACFIQRRLPHLMQLLKHCTLSAEILANLTSRRHLLGRLFLCKASAGMSVTRSSQYLDRHGRHAAWSSSLSFLLASATMCATGHRRAKCVPHVRGRLQNSCTS